MWYNIYMTYTVKEKINLYFKSLDEDQRDVLEGYKLFCFLTFFTTCIFYNLVLTSILLIGLALAIPFLYSDRNKATLDKKTNLVTCEKRNKTFLNTKENTSISPMQFLGFVAIQFLVFIILNALSLQLSYIFPIGLFVIASRIYFVLFSQKLPFSIVKAIKKYSSYDHTYRVHYPISDINNPSDSIITDPSHCYIPDNIYHDTYYNRK